MAVARQSVRDQSVNSSPDQPWKTVGNVDIAIQSLA